MTPTLEKLIKALRAQKYSLFVKCQIANSEQCSLFNAEFTRTPIPCELLQGNKFKSRIA